MVKTVFITKFGGHWIIEDNSIMRYVDRDEKMIMVDIKANFEGLLKKIYYCLKIS